MLPLRDRPRRRVAGERHATHVGTRNNSSVESMGVLACAGAVLCRPGGDRVDEIEARRAGAASLLRSWARSGRRIVDLSAIWPDWVGRVGRFSGIQAAQRTGSDVSVGPSYLAKVRVAGSNLVVRSNITPGQRPISMGLFLVVHRHAYYPGLLFVPVWGPAGGLASGGWWWFRRCGFHDAPVRSWIGLYPSYVHATIGFVTRDFVVRRLCWWRQSLTTEFRADAMSLLRCRASWWSGRLSVAVHHSRVVGSDRKRHRGIVVSSWPGRGSQFDLPLLRERWGGAGRGTMAPQYSSVEGGLRPMALCDVVCQH